MLEGSGGNIGVCIGDDGILIVDDQFAPLAPKILAKIAEIGPGKLRLVLNTHWHGDHVGSNAVFGKDALIVAQENVRKRMQAGNARMAPARLPSSRVLKTQGLAGSRCVLTPPG